MLSRARTSGAQTLARMRDDTHWRRRLVGIGLLVGVLVSVPLATLKPNPFHHARVVRAVFDEAIGVSLVQRDVRMAGVKVGRIGKVRRVGDDAEIELLLDEDVGEIHRDARAALRPHHPFEGTAFIDLDPGSRSAPPLGDAAIPKSHTTTYVSLDQALRFADAPNRAAFKRILSELVPALGPAGQKGIGRMLDNAPTLLRDAVFAARAARGPRGDNLRRVVPGMAATADALAGRGDQLQPAVAEARRTMDALAVDGTRPIDAALARLPETLAAVEPATRAGVRVLDRAELMARAVIPSLQEMVPTAQAATPVLRSMVPTLRALPPVVRNIRGALAALAHGEPGINAAFAAWAPSASRLRRSVGPALHADSSLGQPTYLQFFAGLTALTGMLSPFQAPQSNELGGGHGLRGTLDVAAAVQTAPQSLPVPCSAFDSLNPEFAAAARRAGICTP